MYRQNVFVLGDTGLPNHLNSLVTIFCDDYGENRNFIESSRTLRYL